MRIFYVFAAVLALGVVGYVLLSSKGDSGEATNVQQVVNTDEVVVGNREQQKAESIKLPLAGSAPEDDVHFSIPIEEIRQGCFRQDCIPSIDDPEFVSVNEAGNLLPENAIGIALSYKGVDRFYPFPMLETHELVNDVVAGDALLISYCPLCGTGIVFDRTLDDVPVEFGVSGMLWQSNLLMYNRAESVADRNLWSQVLGEAVVGARSGEKLTVIPSNILRFEDWSGQHPEGEVLGGVARDPYNGDYYRVARQFQPNFDEDQSEIPPAAYVYGVEVNGVYKAYPRGILPIGQTTDVVNGVTLVIQNDEQGVSISNSAGDPVADIEGFWFSWKAAHPETELWTN